ncbi:hypothetical protein FOZ60_015115 [Perkinsus olseni]|uniref:Uncharacterized protein n=1 Tax=Perkinsus olseni TaxID=32597 RepID=A0A7J6P6C5_PEROL|nr:hypothetical protein FOZ60_015115 [Perkinsus olseni]
MKLRTGTLLQGRFLCEVLCRSTRSCATGSLNRLLLVGALSGGGSPDCMPSDPQGSVVLVVPPSSASADPSPSKATRSRRTHKARHGKAGKSNNGQSKPATTDAITGIFGELLAARLLALCSFIGLLMHDKIRLGRPAVQELHTQVLHSGGLSLILAGLDSQVSCLAKLTNSSLTKGTKKRGTKSVLATRQSADLMDNISILAASIACIIANGDEHMLGVLLRGREGASKNSFHSAGRATADFKPLDCMGVRSLCEALMLCLDSPSTTAVLARTIALIAAASKLHGAERLLMVKLNPVSLPSSGKKKGKVASRRQDVMHGLGTSAYYNDGNNQANLVEAGDLTRTESSATGNGGPGSLSSSFESVCLCISKLGVTHGVSGLLVDAIVRHPSKICFQCLRQIRNAIDPSLQTLLFSPRKSSPLAWRHWWTSGKSLPSLVGDLNVVKDAVRSSGHQQILYRATEACPGLMKDTCLRIRSIVSESSTAEEVFRYREPLQREGENGVATPAESVGLRATCSSLDGLDVEALKSSIHRTLVELGGHEGYIRSVEAEAEATEDAALARLLVNARLEVPEEDAPAVVERILEVEKTPLALRHRVAHHFRGGGELAEEHRDGCLPPRLRELAVKLEQENQPTRCTQGDDELKDVSWSFSGVHL